jgi:pimeloyl-ACP methyl ester carboxylesterase
MGGAEASHFTLKYPEMVKAIILEDPGFTKKKNAIFTALAVFFFSLFSPHKKEPGPLEKYEKKGRVTNAKWVERDQKVWAKALWEFHHHYPGKGLKIIFSGADGKKLIPQIQSPILLITAQWGINRKYKARSYQKLNTRLHWVHIKKAGHSIRREQFEQFIDAIKRFLKSIDV